MRFIENKITNIHLEPPPANLVGTTLAGRYYLCGHRNNVVCICADYGHIHHKERNRRSNPGLGGLSQLLADMQERDKRERSDNGTTIPSEV